MKELLLQILKSGIFITEVTYKTGTTDTDYSEYSYNQTTLTSDISLSDADADSSITFTVTIYNNTDSNYQFIGAIYDDTDSSLYSNTNITFTLDGLEVGDELDSKCYVTFTITFSYVDGTVITDNELFSYINFKFGKIIDSYVGLYADIDGDDVIDGIIIADLKKGGSGTYGTGSDITSFSYEANPDGDYSEYVISTDTQSEDFGDLYVVSLDTSKPTGTEDRFYVMALDDVVNSYGGYYFQWYYAGNQYLDSANNTAREDDDFGEGRSNTFRMVSIWAENTDSQNQGGLPDVWGADELQNDPDLTWFVPSKDEWAAFGYAITDVLGISIDYSNYDVYGLDCYGAYWASAQYDTAGAWVMTLANGYITTYGLMANAGLRLCTTF